MCECVRTGKCIECSYLNECSFGHSCMKYNAFVYAFYSATVDSLATMVSEAFPVHLKTVLLINVILMNRLLSYVELPINVTR